MASILSPIFSIIAEYPFSIAISRSLLIFLLPNLKLFKLFYFSFSLIHVIPYNYGSTIKGYLSEFVKIVPFSIETESVGKNYLFQLAIIDSSVSILTGLEAFSLIGIYFYYINLRNYSFIITVLNALLKGPAYDTKELAIRTSPTMRPLYLSNSYIDLPHLSFSEPKALINL